MDTVIVVADRNSVAVSSQRLRHVGGIRAHRSLHLVFAQRDTVRHLRQLAVVQNFCRGLTCGGAARTTLCRVILLAATGKRGTSHHSSHAQRGTLLHGHFALHDIFSFVSFIFLRYSKEMSLICIHLLYHSITT